MYGYPGKSLAAGTGSNRCPLVASFYSLDTVLGKHGSGGNFEGIAAPDIMETLLNKAKPPSPFQAVGTIDSIASEDAR